MLTINSGHDESYLHGIRRTGKVGVDLLGLMLVQADESVKNVVASGGVIWTTLVVREVVLHWADRELLLESVDLVQEKDNTGLDEPSRVADRVEESEGFLHTVDRLVFEEQLVVLGNGDQEENGGNILEAMDPLLTLRTLTTDVEHAVGQIADDESRLSNTSGLDTRAQNILIVWNVVWCCDTVDRVKVVFGRVVELVLTRPLETGLDTNILPKSGNGIANLWWKAVTFDLCRLHEDGLHVVLGALIVERKFQ